MRLYHRSSHAPRRGRPTRHARVVSRQPVLVRGAAEDGSFETREAQRLTCIKTSERRPCTRAASSPGTQDGKEVIDAVNPTVAHQADAVTVLVGHNPPAVVLLLID